MPYQARKEPLYRKVNTQTHGVHHGTGGDYRSERNAQARSEAGRSAMHGKRKRGLDYTPLFRFLLSKVGAEWDGVYSEAVARTYRQPHGPDHPALQALRGRRLEDPQHPPRPVEDVQSLRR